MKKEKELFYKYVNTNAKVGSKDFEYKSTLLTLLMHIGDDVFLSWRKPRRG